ncbi:MAG: hypothetical protein AB7L66_18805 [Gemmatimonadales bacterium]
MRASFVGAAALLAGLAGCQSLDVVNGNSPDRERATRTPGDVQTIAASSFNVLWNSLMGNSPGIPTSVMADEATTGFADFANWDLSKEPRVALDNSTVYQRRGVVENPWYDLYSVISSANDALTALDNGVVIMENGVDVTNRARAFAKLMQAIAHGYLGLRFDRAYVADETMDPETTDFQLQGYEEVTAAAVAQLKQVIAIAGANQFTIPSTGWINGLALTNEDLIKIANFSIARFLAYTPRTPAERAAVDWNEVITHLDAGITQDLYLEAIPEVLFSDFRRLWARQRTTIPGDYARADYYLVGPADTSGAFQAWIAKDVEARTQFQLRTPDRRIQGSTGPTSTGLYFGYNTSTLYASSRGTYHRSSYYFKRWGVGDTWQLGPQLWLARFEADYLRAEALIRLNRASEALPLINALRVANGQLPPVTIDGPPLANNCVPKRLDGTCGSLWDALKYEKRIEMAGVEPGVTWYDARGWGTLVEGTLTQFPIPARELETSQLPGYTFGGAPGTVGSAAAPDYDKCPVTLPRCG